MKKSVYILFLITFLMIGFSLNNLGFANAKNQNSPSGNAVILEKNAFRILRQTNLDEEIVLAYVFPLNSAKMQEIGFSNDEIKTYRFYLTTYVNALSQNSKKKNVDGVSVGNCLYFADIDGVGFAIKFDSPDAQNRFFGVDEDDKNGNKSQTKISGFFIKKLTLKTTFPFSEKSASDVKQICAMAVESWCKDNVVDAEKKTKFLEVFDDSIFVYDFGSQNANLKSSTMYKSDGLFHNVFAKDINEIKENPEIEFYVKEVNKPIWYIFVLSFVLIGVFVALFYFKKKKKL